MAVHRSAVARGLVRFPRSVDGVTPFSFSWDPLPDFGLATTDILSLFPLPVRGYVKFGDAGISIRHRDLNISDADFLAYYPRTGAEIPFRTGVNLSGDGITQVVNAETVFSWVNAPNFDPSTEPEFALKVNNFSAYGSAPLLNVAGLIIVGDQADISGGAIS